MLLSIGCVLFFIGGSFGEPTANQYVDYVLNYVLPTYIRSQKLDPVELPNYTFEYYDRTFLGKVRGKADYTNGYATGLSKIVRDSNCQGPTNFTSHTSISCTLRFSELKTHYDGKVKYGKLPKVSITAKAEVEPTLIDVEFVTFHSETNRPQLTTIDFRSFGLLNTHFTGLGPLNKYMKVLEKNYQDQVSYKLGDIFLHKFRYALDSAVSETRMPLK